MNNWPRVASGDGQIVVTDYGVGVHNSGLYTPTEIVNKGKLLKPQLGEFKPKAFPSPEEGLSQFIWTRWDRFGHKSATEMSNRSRLLSTVQFSQIDIHQNYAGTGLPYVDGYDSYISVRNRFLALERLTKKKHFHNKRLLDLGCAGGLHLLGLASRGIIPYGLEINPWFFREMSPLLRDNVIYGDAMMDTYLFSDSSFDIVISSAHGYTAYSEISQLFSEIARLLVEGGVLLFDVPNRPLDIGPNLISNFRSYLRLLKLAGFKVGYLVSGQMACILHEKKKWIGASN